MVRGSEIQVTAATFELLRDDFVLESRGTVAVKGKGDVETWSLRRRRGREDGIEGGRLATASSVPGSGGD